MKKRTADYTKIGGDGMTDFDKTKETQAEENDMQGLAEQSDFQDNTAAEQEPYEVLSRQALEIERLKGLLVVEGVKSALAAAGVKPEKITKAARMIDTAKISSDGEIDEQALEMELQDLLEEFPELIAMENRKETSRFKIGTDGRQSIPNNEKISSIFGNIR